MSMTVADGWQIVVWAKTVRRSSSQNWNSEKPSFKQDIV